MSLDKNQQKFIENLYIEMYSSLLAYATSVLKHSQSAQEAVQDTFSIACAKVNELSASPNPKGWLVKTLKNVIRNMERTRAVISRMIITSIDIYNIGASKEISIEEQNVDLLYSDLENSEDYLLLKKFALDEHSMLEIAQELGISVEACKKRIQRARKRLKKYFE